MSDIQKYNPEQLMNKLISHEFPEVLEKYSENDLEKFAQQCGTTTGNLMQIAYGGSVSAKLSKKIYEESKKKVLLAELRPDIFS